MNKEYINQNSDIFEDENLSKLFEDLNKLKS